MHSGCTAQQRPHSFYSPCTAATRLPRRGLPFSVFRFASPGRYENF